MRLLFPLLILLLAVLLGASCDETVTGPERPDSTSQNFTFDVTFIDADVEATLYDVCYINDTCIWAVGWIVRNEGNPDHTRYNAVKWNGKKWLEYQIPGMESDGITIDYDVLYTVYGNTPDNIWFSTGARFIHWDGKEFTTVYHLAKEISGRIKECWASGPDNIWMGGMNGELVHFNGRIWLRIKNDIEYDITGIWGNKDTVLIAAMDKVDHTWIKFYTVVNEKVQFLMEDSSVVGVDGVWFDHLSNIHAEGNGSYHYNSVAWSIMDREKSGFALDMSGNSRNDIVVSGHRGAIRHWNGKQWKNWWTFESGWLFGVTMQGDRIWAVGAAGSGKRAVIVTGIRPG